MFDTTLAYFCVHVLLQSTLLIAVGFLAGRLCGQHKPAVQSAILRVTLVAVLLCPVASLTLGKIGITGYALLPAWETQQITRSENASSSGNTNSRLTAPEDLAVNSATENKMSPDSDFDALRNTQVLSVEITSPKNIHSDLTTEFEFSAESFSNASTTTGFMPLMGWIIALTWVTGMIILLAKLLLANRRASRLLRSSREAGAEVQELCRLTSQTLKLLPPKIRISSCVHSPCLIGIWNPLILLPEQKTLTQPVLRDVLLHELAHLARHDCLFHLLARLATVVLFFQPLVWWLSRRLEQVADDICDDYVIHYGSGRKSYANTLVDFAEQLPLRATTTEAGLAMVSLRSSLSRRVLRILDSSRSLTLRLPAKWVILITLLGISATASAALIVNARPESVIDNTMTASPPDEERLLAAAPETIQQTKAVNTAEKAVPEEVDHKQTGTTTKTALRFQGRVVSPDGKPVKQASIIYTRWDMPHEEILATTNEQGTFSFTITPSDELYEVLQNGGTFVVLADGYGPAVKNAYDCEVSGELRNALLARNSNSQAPASLLEKLREKILSGSATFQLVADDTPLTGRVVNIDGQPVAGAKLKVAKLIDGGKEGLDAWEKAARKKGTDYYQLQYLLLNTLGNDIGGTTLDYLPTAFTDKNGQFNFKGLGRDRIVKLLISGPGIATSIVYARTRKGEKIEVPMETRNPSLRTILYHPHSFTHVAGPSLPMEGVVRDSKTKEPLPGVTLQSFQLAGHRMSGWTEGIVHTVSDDQGRYRLEGLPIGENEVLCLSPLDQPYLLSKFTAETRVGGATLQKDLELTRGIWIEGRAYDKDTGEPIQQGQVKYFAFRNNPNVKTVKGFNGAFLSTRYRLNLDGTYRIPGLPGRGLVGILADGVDTKYQRGRGAENIQGRQEHMHGFDTYPFFASTFNFHVISEVNPTEDGETIQLDFPFEAGRSLQVEVVDSEGKPVNGGYYLGTMEAFNNWRIFKGSQLEIKGYQSEEPRRVQVYQEERKLVGYLLIEGKNPTNLKIILEPWAEITGRFVDNSGVPKTTATIGNVFQTLNDNPEIPSLPPHINQPAGQMVGFTTDENGRFTIAGLIPGKNHHLSATEIRKDSIGYYLGEYTIEIPLKPGEVRDLGDIQFKQRGAE